MIKWFGKVIDRLIACAFALLFAQFPEFYKQYADRLAGHVAELKHQVKLIEQAALLSHKTLPEWIHKFELSQDPDFSLQGQLLKGLVDRYTSFQQAESALTNSSIVLKPLAFMRYLDQEVLANTYQNFQPGFSFSFETLVYGGFGLIMGYFLFQLLALAFKNLLKLKASRGF